MAETRGNPLALPKLPRGFTATQLAGGFGPLGAQALAGRIERALFGGSSRSLTTRGVSSVPTGHATDVRCSVPSA